ncbi:acyl carrier protein [Streptomyces sp. MNU76]|jgi:acyl carrier protein|uniref:acyl carrier protein n=1 Tax=Streptomyces sp. MNU76 TaxID=2560026 RepID=UPI001E354A0C|nr:acyl carrier protein [Streptomyces sp. MNU76]MCC9711444.1 acyl carrier protein [Streptomyces sp. MNU76]
MNGYDTLKRIIIEDLKVPSDLVSPGASLEDVEFDSLTLVELTVILERDLGVDIQDQELRDLATLSDMGRLVEDRVAQGQA